MSSVLVLAAGMLLGPETVTAVAPPPTPAVWSTTVVNTGGQDALDECLGGLTRWPDRIDGKPYYPIHRQCGGVPILTLREGDVVDIDGRAWQVTDARDVRKGDSYAAASGLTGDILVQTCYRSPTLMRVVALSAL